MKLHRRSSVWSSPGSGAKRPFRPVSLSKSGRRSIEIEPLHCRQAGPSWAAAGRRPQSAPGPLDHATQRRVALRRDADAEDAGRFSPTIQFIVHSLWVAREPRGELKAIDERRLGQAGSLIVTGPALIKAYASPDPASGSSPPCRVGCRVALLDSRLHRVGRVVTLDAGTLPDAGPASAWRRHHRADVRCGDHRPALSRARATTLLTLNEQHFAGFTAAGLGSSARSDAIDSAERR